MDMACHAQLLNYKGSPSFSLMTNGNCSRNIDTCVLKRLNIILCCEKHVSNKVIIWPLATP